MLDLLYSARDNVVLKELFGTFLLRVENFLNSLQSFRLVDSVPCDREPCKIKHAWSGHIIFCFEYR